MSQEIDITDIIKRISVGDFQQLVYLCLDELCGRPGASPEKFQTSLNCPAEQFAVLISEVKTALLKLVKEKEIQVESCVGPWNELDKPYFACLQNCIQMRQNDVDALRSKLVAKMMSPTLKDFDWNVKWVLGSSSLASLQQPLLSLSLELSDGKRHNLELDLQELSRLLNSLQQAREALQSL